MSPSKRAGGTVDETVAEPASAAEAEAANGDGRAPSSNGSLRTPRPRRTVVSDGSPGSAARGTTSQRGTSSTTIVRTADEEDEPVPPATTVPPPATARAPVPTAPAKPLPSKPAPVAPPAPPAGPARPAGRRLDNSDAPFIGPTIPSGPPPGPVRTLISDHLVAPVPRVLGRRPRVRKVTRVVRHVDPWSVFKVAIVFNLVLYGVLLTAGVLLWNVAHATGTIDNLERFFESFGWDEFEFNGGAIFHNAWIAGLFGVVGLTGAAVLAATLFNLITDLVGGIRMTVLEEEVVEKTAAPMRRFVVQRPTGGGDAGVATRRPVHPTTTLPARFDG